MKTITLTLPERIIAELENYVKQGWFLDESDVIRVALQDFVRRNRLSLSEEFMKEDVEWALSIKKQDVPE